MALSDLFPFDDNNPAGPSFALRARFVILPEGEVLESGTIEIREGRISAIHNRFDPRAIDLGNVTLIPGLVNAHTHLELSDVPAPIQPAQPFTRWLQGVMQHRRARGMDPAVSQAAVQAGRTAAAALGCTTLGDIAGSTPPAAETTSAASPRTVSFLEVLGLGPERRTPQIERARQHLASLPQGEKGLSPHAPYSVHADLLRDVVDLAIADDVPVAMHIAETEAERELLATGTGAFVDFLAELGVWRSDAIPRGSKPLNVLRELARAPRGLVVHGNYLDEEERAFLAQQPQLTVVYCPRTHAFFGHTPHPWKQLRASGIRVAIGTDSRASNPDLSIFAELKFLKQLAPELDPCALLELGTLCGAQALGLDHETGSLAVGKWADLAVVSPGESAPRNVSQLLDPEAYIAGTFCRGRLVPSHGISANP
jgi:aminodeoxyfutalosine deaminase